MRPERDECDPFYWTYVDKVPEGNLLEILETGWAKTAALLGTVSPEKETWAYAPGKWTVREVVGHMIDAERVFGFRALWFARGETSALPSMDQDEFARASRAGRIELAELIDEMAATRTSHLAMLRALDDEALARSGEASGARVSVRALVAIMAGHEIHHRRVLADRYLGHQPASTPDDASTGPASGQGSRDGEPS